MHDQDQQQPKFPASPVSLGPGLDSSSFAAFISHIMVTKTRSGPTLTNEDSKCSRRAHFSGGSFEPSARSRSGIQENQRSPTSRSIQRRETSFLTSGFPPRRVSPRRSAKTTMYTRALIILTLSLSFLSCVSAPRVSHDDDFNYASVFSGLSAPKPAIVNSRLERYTKSLGPINSRERNGEWEFEIVAPREWVNETLQGFRPACKFASSRKPNVPWWAPTERDYRAYEMPHSSYTAAHLYVEKHPKDEKHIRTFVQRH